MKSFNKIFNLKIVTILDNYLNYFEFFCFFVLTFKVNEAHLWAKMDFECRLRGAQYLAYPPVVAGKKLRW